MQDEQGVHITSEALQVAVAYPMQGGTDVCHQQSLKVCMMLVHVGMLPCT
jgi:hypothetical protein